MGDLRARQFRLYFQAFSVSSRTLRSRPDTGLGVLSVNEKKIFSIFFFYLREPIFQLKREFER